MFRQIFSNAVARLRGALKGPEPRGTSPARGGFDGKTARSSNRLAAGGSAPGQASRELVLRARDLSAKGDFVAAAPAWRAVLDVLPDNHQACVRWAEALWANGDERSAVAQAARALALRPQDSFTIALVRRMIAAKPHLFAPEPTSAGLSVAPSRLDDFLLRLQVEAIPNDEAIFQRALARAGALMGAARWRDALGMWIALVEARPDNPTALGGLLDAKDRIERDVGDAFERASDTASTDWAELLRADGPTRASANGQWSADGRSERLDLLRKLYPDVAGSAVFDLLGRLDRARAPGNGGDFPQGLDGGGAAAEMAEVARSLTALLRADEAARASANVQLSDKRSDRLDLLREFYPDAANTTVFDLLGELDRARASVEMRDLLQAMDHGARAGPQTNDVAKSLTAMLEPGEASTDGRPGDGRSERPDLLRELHPGAAKFTVFDLLGELDRDGASDKRLDLLRALEEGDDAATQTKRIARSLNHVRRDGKDPAPKSLYDRSSLVVLRALMGEGNVDAALSRFAGAIDSGPPDAPVATACEIALRLAILLSSKGRTIEAERLIGQASTGMPDGRWLLRARLRSSLVAGRFESSREIAKNAIENEGAPVWAWREAVVELFGNGDAEGAREVFLRSVHDLAPARLSDWLAMANSLPRLILGAEIRGALDRLAPETPQDRLAAARLATRHGCFGLASRWLQDGPAAQEAEFSQELTKISQARLALGLTEGDAVLPADAYAALARRAIDLAEARLPAKPTSVLLANRSLAAGGAERQFTTTALALSRALGGPEHVRVVLTDLRADAGRRVNMPPLIAEGVDVEDLRAFDRPSGPQGAEGLTRDLFRLLGEDLSDPILRLLETLRRTRPAVAHFWQDRTNIDGAIAALLAGVPRIVLSTRSTRPVTQKRLLPFLEAAYKTLLQSPRVTMINNSEAGARDYEQWLGLSAGSVGVVHNGFDFDLMDSRAPEGSAQAVRAALGVPEGAPLIGGVLRMTDVKNPLLWVEAAALVAAQRPEAHFMIVGDGPLRGVVEERAAALGIADRFHLPGFAEVSPYYAAMDVLLLTSRTEGLPNVVVEAQGMGVPAVSTAVGGACEVIHQGRTGWLVEAHEAAPLAERLLFVLSDAAWRTAARELAWGAIRDRYSVSSMTARTLSHYGLQI